MFCALGKQTQWNSASIVRSDSGKALLFVLMRSINNGKQPPRSYYLWREQLLRCSSYGILCNFTLVSVMSSQHIFMWCFRTGYISLFIRTDGRTGNCSSIFCSCPMLIILEYTPPPSKCKKHTSLCCCSKEDRSLVLQYYTRDGRLFMFLASFSVSRYVTKFLPSISEGPLLVF